jgi:hypothetical protein
VVLSDPRRQCPITITESDGIFRLSVDGEFWCAI